MSPFDLTGFDFLRVYLGGVAFALVATLILRAFIRGGFSEPSDEVLEQVGPYDAAYLRDGPRGAILAGIAALVQQGRVQLDASGGVTLTDAGPPRELVAEGVYRGVITAHETPLERAIVAAIAAGADDCGQVIEACAEDTRELELRAAALGLAHTRLGLLVRSWGARLPVLLLIAFGAIKILVGLSRDRPVGFLVGLVLLTLNLLFIRERRRRTRRGDRALALLEDRNAALESTARTAPEQLSPADVALAAGLFGGGALWGAPFSGLAVAGAGPAQSKSAWSASSCGGSSCSTGSSCGSSCGGGCGGCGGCGG